MKIIKATSKAADAIVKQLDRMFMNESAILPVFEIEESRESEIEGRMEKTEYLSVILAQEHDVTFYAFKGFAKRHPGAGMILFDAHPDIETDFKAGKKKYIRELIEQNIINPERIILVGVRKWHANECEYLKAKKIKHYSMREISFEGLTEVSDSVMSVARQWPAIFLSIDLDVLDPAFAPGTKRQEPGGMSSRELIFFIQRLKLLKSLKAVLIACLEPEKDINDLTAKLAAKLIFELS